MFKSDGKSYIKTVRPTSGKVIGALFSILGNLRGRAFLDLFSGTGRVALQALERGASPVVAVELLAPRAREIKAFFTDSSGFMVLSMDVRRALSLLIRKGYGVSSDGEGGFDIIFADPPYEAGWANILGDMIFSANNGILSNDGFLVIEHSIREEVPCGKGYQIFDSREYGETVLTFLAPRIDSLS